GAGRRSLPAPGDRGGGAGVRRDERVVRRHRALLADPAQALEAEAVARAQRQPQPVLDVEARTLELAPPRLHAEADHLADVTVELAVHRRPHAALEFLPPRRLL